MIRWFRWACWVDEATRPTGSLETAIGNTIGYFRGNDRTQLINPRTFEQIAKHPEGRSVFIQYYSICFNHNIGKVFDTTPVVKAMEAIKANMEEEEMIGFIKYPEYINSVDELITYLKAVRDCPEILIMEM